MRLIDGDALQEKLTKKKPGPANARYTEGFNDALLRFKSMIHTAPTIEPQRKKGHWIRHPEQRNIFNGKTIECSECHEKYTVQYVEDELFCRHCGADMREPEDIPMEYFESGGR